MDLQNLIKKAKEFTFSRESLNETKQKRESFLQRFPLSTLLNLTIDEYANTPSKDCFIYWLEHKGVLGGIGGGNASKFGIYRTVNGEYCRGVGPKKVSLKGNELDQEFSKLKQGYINAIELAKKEMWTELEKLELPVFNMVLLKILNIYLPDRFFNVYSSNVLIQLGKILEVEADLLKPEHLIHLNYQVLQKLKSIEILHNWSNDEISQFIWDLFSQQNKSVDLTRNYWLVGYTYDNEGSQKEWFIENKYVGIGFLREDLSSYIQNESIDHVIENQGLEPRAQRALRQFFQIKEGDLVALKSTYIRKIDDKNVSVLKISAIGKVTQDAWNGGYEFQPKHGHLLPVEWVDLEERELFGLGGGYQRTLNQARDEDVVQQVFYKKQIIEKLNDTPFQVRPFAKNYVLYGPPGTGKTFQVAELALKLINEKVYLELKSNGRKAIQDEYHRLMEEGQIHFVTFHQSYSYEDFIEGLKSDGQGNFVPTNGLLKDIVLEATYEGIQKTQPVITDEVQFERLYRYLVENGLTERIEFVSKTGSTCFISKVSPQGNLVVTTEGAKSSTIVSRDRLFALFQYVKENKIDWQQNVTFVRDAIGGCNQTWYWSVLNWILTRVEQPDSFEEIELEAMDKNAMIQNALKNRESFNFDQSKNFVLIIDEMNRGNISKILGELMTLLEEDKRLTAENELILELPYSKEKFALPPNLFIIGTMNTADRSIALLDTALRRRFVFQEVLPDAEQLGEVGEIDLSEMLTIMNRRIEVLYDRDHMIGHAYFIHAKSEEEIIAVFQNKIIPLLQEYFYDDWEKIGLILGGIGRSVEDHYIVYQDNVKIEELFKHKPQIHIPTLYRVKNRITIEEIKAIYE